MTILTLSARLASGGELTEHRRIAAPSHRACSQALAELHAEARRLLREHPDFLRITVRKEPHV